MIEDYHFLSIVIPASMALFPVRVIRGGSESAIICSVEDGDKEPIEPNKEHTLIWNRGEFVRVSLQDIISIEADGSYSLIQFKNQEPIMVSYSLSVVQKSLPAQHFVRIHRSTILNIAHITHLCGNSFRVAGKLYTIGREYRKQVKSRFIFIGVKRGSNGDNG